MPMNLALQRHTIEKKLRNKGINPDKIDLEAELDSTLSLPENIQNLEEKYGKLQRTGRNAGARQERAKAQRRKQAQREARQFNKQRPEYNRYVDATKDAEKTFADPTERQMKKWKQNPNKYDIKGVDTRKPAERRPQTELPIQRRRDKILYKGGKGELKKSMRKIPGSIQRNVKGPKERIARKKREQGAGEMMTERKRLALPQNALVSNYDIPEVIEEDRQRVMDKEEMLKFEREERLEAESGTGASNILKGDWRGAEAKHLEKKGYFDNDRYNFSDSKTSKKWENNYI